MDTYLGVWEHAGEESHWTGQDVLSEIVIRCCSGASGVKLAGAGDALESKGLCNGGMTGNSKNRS